jgi:hypothetical protein
MTTPSAEPDTKSATPKRPKGRSPAYPGVDLKRALELISLLYKSDHQHPASFETVAGHWKMKANSSQFFTALSAVKKYGLANAGTQRGPESKQIHVSDLARDIILDDREDSQERDAAIRKAALLPAIHNQLWRKYGGDLPSDQNLRFYLIRDLKFTEAGASEFIGEFKRTIAFANLTANDGLSDPIDDKLDDEDEDSMPDLVEQSRETTLKPPQPPAGGGRQPQIREVPIPIQGDSWPALKAAFPMTEEAWTQMIAVLTAMKPGLVAPKKD